MTVVALGVLAALAALVWYLLRDGEPEPFPRAAAPGPSIAAQPDAALEDGEAGGPAEPLRLHGGAIDDLLDNDQRVESAATLRGEVVSIGDGTPIPGAELIFDHGGGVHSVTSGDGGEFVFRTSDFGTFELIGVVADGYEPLAPQPPRRPMTFVARPGVHVRGAVVQLHPARERTVRVVAPDGKPLAGAEIELLEPLSEVTAQQTIFVTDQGGAVRFAPPLLGLLEGHHSDYLPTRVRVMDDDKDIVIRLRPPGPARGTGAISGEVVDETDLPIAGARIIARSADRRRPGGPEAAFERRSDDDGTFAFPELPAGVYVLRAYAGDYAVAVSPLIRTGTGAVRLVLTAGAVLEGSVRAGDTGEPVVAFSLSVRCGSGARNVSLFDGDGLFELKGLPPERCTVHAAAAGYPAASPVTVDLDPSRPARADIVFEPGGRVFGVVVDEVTGARLAGARVQIEGFFAGGGFGTPVAMNGTTSADGSFELGGLAGGLRSITASAPNYHPRIVSGLDVTPKGEVGPVTIALTPLGEGESPRLEITGIGAQLSKGESSDGGLVTVVSVFDGGGASEIGLARGDAILAVDGTPTGDMEFGDVIEHIRGREGTMVSLRVRKAGTGEELDLAVSRRRVRTN